MATLSNIDYYEHITIPRAGFIPHYTPQVRAEAASGQTIVRGSLVSLDSDGKWVAGLGSQATLPFWIMNSSSDYDVSAEPGGADALLNGLCPMGVELWTTEFVTGSYSPNTWLQAAAGDDAGKVTAFSGTPTGRTVMLVGVVTEANVAREFSDISHTGLCFIPSVQYPIAS